MELKLFGKSLFKFEKKDSYLLPAMNTIKESKYLIDFQEGIGNFFESWGGAIMEMPNGTITTATSAGKVKKVKEVKVEVKEKLTPKGVFDLQLLHDKTFQLKTDPEYIDEQLTLFKDKLSLIKAEEYDMARGTKEIASIISRLENRKKYPDFKSFFDEYPYTSSGRIEALVKEHDYLKLGQVAQFLADMPKDAIQAMKDYNKNIDKMCGKQAVFYIIADKKDFEKSNTRRDPILLAQSPFGHFWQILGAWDKEMMFLGEL